MVSPPPMEPGQRAEACVPDEVSVVQCFRCHRVLGRTYTLASHGELEIVCEYCYLLGSLAALAPGVGDAEARELIIEQLRHVTLLAYTLQITS